MVRYWGNEWGYRTFDIYIDNDKLLTENITGKWNVSEFRNVEYPIPSSMVEGKNNIRVKFQAPASGYAGGVFYIRLLKQEVTAIHEQVKPQEKLVIQGTEKAIQVSGLKERATLNVYNLSGKLIHEFAVDPVDQCLSVDPGFYIVQLTSGNTNIATGKVIVF